MGFKNKDLKKIKSNVGMSYAFYDEGAWQNELKNGDMSIAPEALRLINNQIKSDTKIDTIEIGRYYGQLSDRTLSIIYNEKIIHPLQPYSTEAMDNQISFFLRVFNIQNSILPQNQVWFWKELLTLVSLVFSFLLIIPITKLLLQLPYFRSLVYPIPDQIPQQERTAKIIFWVIIVFSSVIACFSYIPLSELSKILFSDASSRIQTWFFPQRMNNAIMLWALFNGTLGILLFFGSYHYFGKNNGVVPTMWGISITLKELQKTILLGLIIFFFYFLLLSVVYYLFNVDYRFIFLGVRTFRPITLLLIPMYLPAFLIFFLSNSIRVNSAMRIKGNKEIKNIFFSAFATASGLMLILLIQYITLWKSGTVYWEEGWLYVNLLFAIVPIMFVLPFFQRYFFNLTGKIYLGPITMSLIFIMILLSNTVCYFPL